MGAPPGSSGPPPVACAAGAWSVYESAGRWRMTQPSGRMLPAHQLAVLCLTGSQPGQRSAFSLEGCQRWPVADEEQGQIPAEWAGIRAYLPHQLSTVCSLAGASGGWLARQLPQPGHRTADLGIWEPFKAMQRPPCCRAEVSEDQRVTEELAPEPGCPTPTSVLFCHVPFGTGSQLGSGIRATVLQHLSLRTHSSLRSIKFCFGRLN